MSELNNYAQLVSLQYFLQHAVKSIVYVHIVCKAGDSSSCSILDQLNLHQKDWFDFLAKKGFNIEKKMCINLRNAPLKEYKNLLFRKLIFQDSSPNITVLFNQWRGCDFSPYRVGL